MVARLSPLRSGRTLLPENIIIFLILVSISVTPIIIKKLQNYIWYMMDSLYGELHVLVFYTNTGMLTAKITTMSTTHRFFKIDILLSLVGPLALRPIKDNSSQCHR
jgi:hypothetical protein